MKQFLILLIGLACLGGCLPTLQDLREEPAAVEARAAGNYAAMARCILNRAENSRDYPWDGFTYSYFDDAEQRAARVLARQIPAFGWWGPQQPSFEFLAFEHSGMVSVQARRYKRSTYLQEPLQKLIEACATP